MIETFYDWLPILLMIVAFVEFLIRVLPTSKNYSLTDFIRLIFAKVGELIDTYIPNRRDNE